MLNRLFFLAKSLKRKCFTKLLSKTTIVRDQLRMNCTKGRKKECLLDAAAAAHQSGLSRLHRNNLRDAKRSRRFTITLMASRNPECTDNLFLLFSLFHFERLDARCEIHTQYVYHRKSLCFDRSRFLFLL